MLKIRHISKTFNPGTINEKRAITDLSLELKKGDFATIIGSNGAGKSTLFNAICGDFFTDSGSIELDGRDITFTPQHARARSIGRLYQDPMRGTAPGMTIEENLALAAGKGGWLSHVTHQEKERFHEELKLLDIGLERDVTDLSGGQRTKVLLGKLLLEKPDILLLDEPTNYLDEEHIEWLKRYLQDYENAFILISHDIPFLNSVINLVYHMENQELNRYVGDYDHFQEVYEVKKAQLEAAYRRQQQEISELKDFVARNKARVSTRNMAMSRQKKLDKMDVIELAAEKPKPEFHFKYGRTPGKYIFETKDLVIGYNEPLSRPVTLSMERGNKIALVGANGIGKTTLLKSILGLIPSLKGSCELGENLQIGYFEQEVKGDNKTTCIDEIWAEFPSYTQYEVRSALAKCGLTTKHIESQVRVLSGGEQAKVRLCKLVNKETNILLLDEPTNHLDVDAKEALKQALIEYKGSILLICHEPEFYRDVVSQVWDCSKWTTKVL